MVASNFKVGIVSLSHVSSLLTTPSLATNFFESQPVKNAAVYFMRLVLHDWPDNKCLQILQILREAAAPTTKLIVFDQLMTYACDYDGPFSEVSNPTKPPAPLLANLGMGEGGFVTMIDMQARLVSSLISRL